MTASRSSFRGDVQGLRAVAVLAVVLYHAGWGSFSGGYVGVDIFFVISGYLITGLLLREVEDTGRIDFAGFYARRMRRLLPAVTVLLVATTIGARLLLSPLDQRELAPSILSAAAYASNFWFGARAVDYLGGDIRQDPVMHTWSLAVEEQFYLVWPLLLLLALRWGSAITRRRRLAITMVAVLVVSFAAGLWMLARSRPWAFFASPLRAWEFAVGGLVCVAEARLASIPDRVRGAIAMIGAAAIVIAVTRFTDGTAFPGAAAALPVIGAGMVLLAGSSSRAPLVSRALDTPAMRTIGDLSYSWYLWHWPLLAFPALLGLGFGRIAQTGCALLSLVIAWASYRWVENPIRFHRRLVRMPRRSLALGATLTACAAAVAIALQLSANRALASARLAIADARGDLPRVYADGCHGSFTDVRPPTCVYGDTLASRTILLAGDSHAAQWFPALERIARVGRWRLISITKSACPVAMVTPFNPTLGRRYDECEAWRARVLARVAEVRPAVVIVSHAFGYVEDTVHHVTAAEWQAGMRETMRRLRQSEAAVVVIRDTPRPAGDLPRCLARAAWRHQPTSSCDFVPDTTRDAHFFGLDRAAARGIDGVALIDLSDVICAGGTCEAVRDGKASYRDDGHLTARTVEALAPALQARLAAAGVLAPDSARAQDGRVAGGGALKIVRSAAPVAGLAGRSAAATSTRQAAPRRSPEK